MLSNRRTAHIGLVAATALLVLGMGVLLLGSVQAHGRPLVRPGMVVPLDTIDVAVGAAGLAPRLSSDKPVTVVYFSSASDQSAAQSDAQAMQLAQTYRHDDAVRWLTIHLNVDPADSARRELRLRDSIEGLGSSSIIDDKHQLADRFDVRDTPVCFVLDAAGTVCYRGPVVDNARQLADQAIQALVDHVRGEHLSLAAASR